MKKHIEFMRYVLEAAMPATSMPDLTLTARSINAQMLGDDEEELPPMLEPPPGSPYSVHLCYFTAWVNYLHNHYEVCGAISTPEGRAECRANAYKGYLEVVALCNPV